MKAKWKCLRDNFRIQWKMIPRDENDDLLIAPEEFTGTKWQYYKHLLFLAGNMGKTRTYNQNIQDDQNYDLLQLYDEPNEMPSLSNEEFETKYDRKTSIAMYQQQLHQQHLQQEQFEQQQKALKQLPKLRTIIQQKVNDVKPLIGRTIPQSEFSPLPVAPTKNHHHQQTSLKPSPFDHKRKRLDEVTTTNGGNSSHFSSNEEYPSASSPNLPNIPNDDDYHFIMSLKPYLHQFSGPQKLKVQMRIQKLVFKELYKDEIDDED